jgi:hypothetical protein
VDQPLEEPWITEDRRLVAVCDPTGDPVVRRFRMIDARTATDVNQELVGSVEQAARVEKAMAGWRWRPMRRIELRDDREAAAAVPNELVPALPSLPRIAMAKGNGIEVRYSDANVLVEEIGGTVLVSQRVDGWAHDPAATEGCEQVVFTTLGAAWGDLDSQLVVLRLRKGIPAGCDGLGEHRVLPLGGVPP